MALLGACMGEVEEVTVLINDLKHALARSMGGGGGRVLELLDSWGRNLWGLSDSSFFLLSPGPKTWYLNYALYGLFDASLASLFVGTHSNNLSGKAGGKAANQGQISMEISFASLYVPHTNLRGSTTKDPV